MIKPHHPSTKLATSPKDTFGRHQQGTTIVKGKICPQGMANSSVNPTIGLQEWSCQCRQLSLSQAALKAGSGCYSFDTVAPTAKGGLWGGSSIGGALKPNRRAWCILMRANSLNTYSCSDATTAGAQWECWRQKSRHHSITYPGSTYSGDS
jgi:hypothetical protein